MKKINAECKFEELIGEACEKYEKKIKMNRKTQEKVPKKIKKQLLKK